MTLLTPDELASLFKVPRRRALEIAKIDGFPPSLTGWRKPRWMLEAVEEWARNHAFSEA